MADGLDQPDPPERPRVQILKDLEKAGLLTNIDEKSARRRSTDKKPESVVLPFRRPAKESPTSTLLKRRFAGAAYVAVAALCAWLYFAH
jgi:hypothetical protein